MKPKLLQSEHKFFRSPSTSKTQEKTGHFLEWPEGYFVIINSRILLLIKGLRITAEMYFNEQRRILVVFKLACFVGHPVSSYFEINVLLLNSELQYVVFSI